MNKIFIYEYINRLKRDDIINYCNRKNISITNSEIDIIYGYISSKRREK